MKLIDKMLMEYKTTTATLYMAIITIKDDGTADMMCAFSDGRKETSRSTKNYKDRHEAARVLEEMTKQHPGDELPATIINNIPRCSVIADDIAEVMQCVPA
jgi:hypothetical protein